MTDDVERRHQLALERQQRAHQNSISRAEASEARRVHRETEAQLGELDAMRLKHELDQENRGFDHQFNRAEDARELERLATETALRRKDDFIRKAWDDDAAMQKLEGEIVRLVTEHRSKVAFENQRHANEMEVKALDASNLAAQTADEHQNAKEMAVLNNELDKENFEFKQRLLAELGRETQNMDASKILSVMKRLKGVGES